MVSPKAYEVAAPFAALLAAPQTDATEEPPKIR